MTLDKKDKKWINKAFKRYSDIIGEDFIDKIKPVTEMQESQGKLLKTTFDEVGNIKTKATGIELKLDKIESRLNTIELRLNTIESGIKQLDKNIAKSKKEVEEIRSDIIRIRKGPRQKPKKKEFEILRQKVIVLEKKLEKV